jgi:hypothetical protein
MLSACRPLDLFFRDARPAAPHASPPAAHDHVHGQADQHWLAAEREILAASTVALVREPAPQKKRRSPARSKTTKTLAVAS